MIAWFAKIAGASWFIYLKLAIVVALIAGAVFLTWNVRSAMAKKDQDKAVATAVKEISRELDVERTARAKAETTSNEKLDALLILISNVQVQQAQLKEGIAKERLANKKFYEQALPPGGFEQWKKARALAGSSPASSPSP